MQPKWRALGGHRFRSHLRQERLRRPSLTQCLDVLVATWWCGVGRAAVSLTRTIPAAAGRVRNSPCSPIPESGKLHLRNSLHAGACNGTKRALQLAYNFSLLDVIQRCAAVEDVGMHRQYWHSALCEK